MEANQIKSFSGQLKALMEANKDFPQKLKQHLVSESSKVKNPCKFILELLNEVVLWDGSSDLDAHVGFKEMVVQLGVTIGCSKGADEIDGFVKALESSGNLQLLSALQTWAKEDLGIESDDDGGGPSEPEAGTSAIQSPPRKKSRKNVTSSTELSYSGAKLFVMIMSHMEEDGFMEQLEAHLVAKAPEIVHPSEFLASLRHQNVLVKTDDATRVTRQKNRSVAQLASGPQAQGGQHIEGAIKAACSKKTIIPLVLAFDNSSNERILVEVLDWIESSEARKKINPVAVKSFGNQPKPSATGLLAATREGLISLDLRTLEAKAITSEHAIAVAVNHKLNKVYWSEMWSNSRIMRSNFDGSGKEIIVPQQGSGIIMLAIDDSSGNVYYSLRNSHEITVCDALGLNCAVVISNSPLVKYPMNIALDSENGFIYWSNFGSVPNSLVRADRDGSNATIISTGWKELYGITLDQPSNDVLYWADWGANTIGTVDVNGGDMHTLVKLEGSSGPNTIQVDAHKIYFSNYKIRNVQCVDRDSGKELTTIFNSTGAIEDIALFHAPV